MSSHAVIMLEYLLAEYGLFTVAYSPLCVVSSLCTCIHVYVVISVYVYPAFCITFNKHWVTHIFALLQHQYLFHAQPYLLSFLFPINKLLNNSTI